MGRFENTPAADFRRVIETNLFGTVHGARAALPIFQEQGSGVLVNVSSVVGSVPQPYASAYVMSKHAIRALGMTLRQELLLQGAKDIHVCTVMPAVIDTPIFQHAGNYTGKAIKAMPPVYPPEQVAETIVGLVERPRREVSVGSTAPMMIAMRTVAPGLAEQMMARQVDKLHLDQDTPAPPTSGNLFQPLPQYATVTGGWRSDGSARQRPLALGLAAAVPAFLALRWARRRSERPRRSRGWLRA
jgi:short-subunit dehydrogenase